LDRETIGLRPSAAGLQSFIESPSKVVSSFFIHYRSPFKCTIRASNALPGFVPTPFPNIQSETTNPIDVGRTTDFVVTEDARFEENSNSLFPQSFVTSRPN
jgi:hypothetical protein